MNHDNLLKQCQSDLADFGSLTPKKVKELVKNYQSLIEMNAGLHKENAKLKQELTVSTWVDDFDGNY